MLRSWFVLSVLCLTALPASTQAAPITFEGFSDGTALTNQYLGLIFSNASILSAGFSLNEFEFPPHSGSNIATDDGGPISITVLGHIVSFSGYFTYGTRLTLAAFDASNSLVASITSSYSNNEALSGDAGSSPNELLHFISAIDISKIIITGDPSGGSFTVDDIDPIARATGVPEPSTLLLATLGLLSVFLFGKRAFLYSGVTMAVVTSMSSAGLAAPTLGAISITPQIVTVSSPTVVVVSVSIPDPSVIPTGVNLLRVSADGASVSLGQFRDDGLEGDRRAGDSIYTIRTTVNEAAAGQVSLQVSAAFRGVLARVRSYVLTVLVQPGNLPDLALSALADSLSTANIPNALPFFSDQQKATRVLGTLDSVGLAQLGFSFKNAKVIENTSDTRTYSMAIITPRGPDTGTFTMSPDSIGNWVIVSW